MDPLAATHSDAPVDPDADRRTLRAADVFATIVGLLLLIPGVLWLVWMSAWLGAVTGQCGGLNACDDGLIQAGRVIAGLGPLVVWVLALIVSVVRLVLRRSAWWISPLAFVVAIVVLNVGAWIAHRGANLA